MVRPEISVIIPHYNQPDALRVCLASLHRQSCAQNCYEIIVADNASSCSLAAIKERFPDILFITVKERGAAPARNAGMAAARGNVFAFIDADCVADINWISNGAAALANADLAGGDILVSVRNEKAPSPVECFEREFAFQQRTYIKRKQFSVTANLFATREAAEAIGPFKNGVAEDVDWCHRAAALGFRLAFNDTSIISHPARRDFYELTRKWDRLIRERWNGFGGRGWIRRMKWAGLAAATALSTAPHLPRILASKRIRGVRDKMAAAGVLARIRFWRARRMMAML